MLEYYYRKTLSEWLHYKSNFKSQFTSCKSGERWLSEGAWKLISALKLLTSLAAASPAKNCTLQAINIGLFMMQDAFHFSFVLLMVGKRGQDVQGILYMNINLYSSVNTCIYLYGWLVVSVWIHTRLAVVLILKNAVKLALFKDANIIGKKHIFFLFVNVFCASVLIP